MSAALKIVVMAPVILCITYFLSTIADLRPVSTRTLIHYLFEDLYL